MNRAGCSSGGRAPESGSSPAATFEREADIVSGLRREVREETGLAARPVRLTGVNEHMPAAVVALVFRGDAEPDVRFRATR
jgi:hypothetical protein